MRAPPTCPPGIRLARDGDQKPLFDLCMEAYSDNGWGGIDPVTVRDTIAKACRGETFAFGVIPGLDGRLEATLGLMPSRMWYGDQGSWWYSDMVIFVRKDCRRSRHFSKLMQFARWFEHIAQAPVLLSITPREDFERKHKAFSRYGRHLTSTFLIGSGQFRYMQQVAA